MLLKPIYMYDVCNPYTFMLITTYTRLHLLQPMHVYDCSSTYIITFAVTCTSLRLLQHIHVYICCNIYITTFVATCTWLHLLQAPAYASDIVHSENATHQPSQSSSCTSNLSLCFYLSIPLKAPNTNSLVRASQGIPKQTISIFLHISTILVLLP